MEQHDTIVVGVDGSPGGRAAFATARRLAHALDARLVVVYVRHLPSVITSTAALGPATKAIDEVAEMVRVEVGKALVDDHDVAWQYELRDGDPTAELLAVADERGATLIVVGHNGHSQLGSLLLGSVATRLVHHAKQSVLVARDPA